MLSTVHSKLLDVFLADSPLTIVDVGARGGLHPRWNGLARWVDGVGFEPEPEECARLNAAARSTGLRSLRFFPFALGREVTPEAVFRVCESPGCSSLYAPNNAFADQFHYGNNLKVLRTLTFALTTLDAVCRAEGVRPDYLKVDTQGAELDILKGAEGALASIKVIELEVEFNRLYEDQPLFGDVDRWLRERGFMLLGIRRSVWRRRFPEAGGHSSRGGTLVHGDALFVNEALLDAGTPLPVDVIKMCALLSAYRQDDFVGQLLLEPHPSLRDLAEGDRRALVSALESRLSGRSRWLAPLTRFFSQRRLRQLGDDARSPGAVDWHDPDFF